LHFVARRGFLSSKKQVAGDLVDDPDTQTYLSTLDSKQTKDEEGQFKDISAFLIFRCGYSFFYSFVENSRT
jgi:hypothetical protein